MLFRHVELSNPFRAYDLPLIVRLSQLAYHRYRKRWTKRIFKRPARLAFDFAYGVLRMTGEGGLDLSLPDGTRSLRFNGRNGQFGAIYNFPDEHIFEAPIIGLMAVLLADDDRFFDVGANWGCLSLHAAALNGFRGDIHAFEPVPDTFTDLQDLVAQAGLEKRVHCHRAALSDRSGRGAMVMPDPAQSGWAQVTEEGGFEIDLRRLDDLDLAPPKLIKIDAEGHELAVLEGAEATLTESKPYVVFESWFDAADTATMAGPWRLLERLGYTFYCPAWGLEPDYTLISMTNMPPDGSAGFPLRLVPCTLEQRMFGPQHWSYLACHRDRHAELAAAFSDRT